MISKNTSELAASINVDNSYSIDSNFVQRVLTPNIFSTAWVNGSSRVREVLQTVKEHSPVLYWVVLCTLSLGVGCLFGLAIDDRTLMGINVWVKPLKFCISIAVYIATVGFLLPLYPYSRRKTNWINGIVTWTLFIELGIIICQAARGVQSHYNMTTAFDAILYLAMGLLTGINVLILIVLIIDTIRLKLNTKKSIQWAILMGWVIVFFGSWIGGQMISQLAHNVGVADGGAGLPLVNWSTIGGDLRIAHFFGLHGIQIIPLFAFWLAKKEKVSSKNQLLAVTLFGLLYAAWIGFVFYQAKQGMPLLHQY